MRMGDKTWEAPYIPHIYFQKHSPNEPVLSVLSTLRISVCLFESDALSRIISSHKPVADQDHPLIYGINTLLIIT